MILNLTDAERRVLAVLSRDARPGDPCGRAVSVAELAAATDLPEPELRAVVMRLWEHGWLLCLDGAPWRPESDCLLRAERLTDAPGVPEPPRT